MTDNYFEIIPRELTELILLSAFKDISILDIKETGLFNNLLYDIQFWKKVYAEYELPIFNVNVKIMFDSNKFLLDDKMFNIIALDHIKIFGALIDYERLIKSDHAFKIPMEYIDLSILYNHINIPDHLIESLFDRSTTLYYVNKQSIDDKQLIINTKTMKFLIRSEHFVYEHIFVPDNPTKFIKDIIIWLSYHRYKINITSLK